MGTLKSHALPEMAASRRPVAKTRGRPLRKRWSLAAWIALIPMVVTVVFAYLGTMLWTARVSLSNSRTFPSNDFVGFTHATENLAAEDLVTLLHSYFTAFDRIVGRYGLEKLKTIGAGSRSWAMHSWW